MQVLIQGVDSSASRWAADRAAGRSCWAAGRGSREVEERGAAHDLPRAAAARAVDAAGGEGVDLLEQAHAADGVGDARLERQRRVAPRLRPVRLARRGARVVEQRRLDGRRRQRRRRVGRPDPEGGHGHPRAARVERRRARRLVERAQVVVEARRAALVVGQPARAVARKLAQVVGAVALRESVAAWPALRPVPDKPGQLVLLRRAALRAHGGVRHVQVLLPPCGPVVVHHRPRRAVAVLEAAEEVGGRASDADGVEKERWHRLRRRHDRELSSGVRTQQSSLAGGGATSAANACQFAEVRSRALLHAARSQIILVYCYLPAKHWCVICTELVTSSR